MSEIVGTRATFAMIDDPYADEEDDDRELTHWLFDVAVIPTLIVALVALLVCVALGAIYGCLCFAALIYQFFT